MGQKRMTDLDVFETSGVDHPAHLHEGFAVMKSSDPDKASALMRALGKDTSRMTTKTAPPSDAKKSLADIIALGDGALATAKADDVTKGIDTKLQAALDTLATAWQDLRSYAESQDDSTPSANTNSDATATDPVDPTLAAAAQAAGLDPALAKSADPNVQALLKAVGDQITEARKSAVLLALFSQDGETHLAFIRSATTLRAHGGEIAFPGGSYDPSDSSLVATALREAAEEIGLHPTRVDVLGLLSPVFTVVSNFLILPVVAYLPEGPGQLLAQASEVAEVLLLPLAALSDPAIAHTEIWSNGGHTRPVYFYDLAGEVVWGATARIIHDCLALAAEEAGVATHELVEVFGR